MIKILSTEQIRKADRVTIENKDITSDQLMERAATACSDWIIEQFDTHRPVLIFAGVGNNGGDALVIARKLLAEGFHVETYVARFSEKFSEDFQLNLDRLNKENHEVKYVFEEDQFPGIPSDAIVVDGLFGSGIKRKVEGFTAKLIEQINSSIAEVVSIDMPSGMFADQHTPEDYPVVEASYTLTFQVPKLAFFIEGSHLKLGEWHIIPIGLDEQYIAEAKSTFYYVDNIRSFGIHFVRDKFSHKGDFGHSLIIAGSYGKMGAAVLSTRAAVKTGAGKVTACIPKCGYEIMQLAVPEAMTVMDDYYEYISEIPNVSGFNAIGIGPGIGIQKKTRRMLKGLLASHKAPVVLDADALNLISKSGKPEEWLPENSILTPHPGEFERLFGETKDDYDRLKLLKDKAEEWKVFILLKGAYSALATPNGDVYFNPTGNPGMATGGSGDVLTGMITALLGQTNDPFISALCGMYIHGHAGDLVAHLHGEQALAAGDIIDMIGEAIMDVFDQRS